MDSARLPPTLSSRATGHPGARKCILKPWKAAALRLRSRDSCRNYSVRVGSRDPPDQGRIVAGRLPGRAEARRLRAGVGNGRGAPPSALRLPPPESGPLCPLLGRSGAKLGSAERCSAGSGGRERRGAQGVARRAGGWGGGSVVTPDGRRCLSGHGHPRPAARAGPDVSVARGLRRGVPADPTLWVRGRHKGQEA